MNVRTSVAVIAAAALLAACTQDTQGAPKAGTSSSSTSSAPSVSAPSAAGVAGSQPAAGSSAPALTDSEASQLSNDIASGDQHRIDDSVLLPGDVDLQSEVVSELRSLGHITFQTNTFAEVGPDTATLTATTPDGTSWLVTIVRVDGHWKISTTEQQ